jgi:hypothetical protein
MQNLKSCMAVQVLGVRKLIVAGQPQRIPGSPFNRSNCVSVKRWACIASAKSPTSRAPYALGATLV